MTFMARNRFLDDPNVIKQQIEKQVIIEEEPEVNLKEEKMHDEVKKEKVKQKPKTKKQAEKNKKEKGALKNEIESETIVEEQENNYFDKINNYKDKIEDHANENMPIYEYSKDMNTGLTKIQTQKSKKLENTGVIEKPMSYEKEIIIKLLDKAAYEIFRLNIEIDVHMQILKEEANDNKAKIYESKIKMMKDDLDFNIKRKIILKRMLEV